MHFYSCLYFWQRQYDPASCVCVTDSKGWAVAFIPNFQMILAAFLLAPLNTKLLKTLLSAS